jgi:hypothetical protein
MIEQLPEPYLYASHTVGNTRDVPSWVKSTHIRGFVERAQCAGWTHEYLSEIIPGGAGLSDLLLGPVQDWMKRKSLEVLDLATLVRNKMMAVDQ